MTRHFELFIGYIPLREGKLIHPHPMGVGCLLSSFPPTSQDVFNTPLIQPNTSIQPRGVYG